MTVPWYERDEDRNAFARVLSDINLLQDKSNILEFYEKPYKWDTEYEAWVEHGKPVEGDVQWYHFLNAIDEIVEIT